MRLNDSDPHLRVHFQPFDIVDLQGAIGVFQHIERNNFIQSELIDVFVVDRLGEFVVQIHLNAIALIEFGNTDQVHA